MVPLVLSKEDFGRCIVSEVERRFREIAAAGSVVSGEGGLARATFSIEFTVTARKKKPEPEPEPEPEPVICCECFRTAGGMRICAGDCCLGPEDFEPVPG